MAAVSSRLLYEDMQIPDAYPHDPEALPHQHANMEELFLRASVPHAADADETATEQYPSEERGEQLGRSHAAPQSRGSAVTWLFSSQKGHQLLFVMHDKLGIVALPGVEVGAEEDHVGPQKAPAVARADKSKVEHAHCRLGVEENAPSPGPMSQSHSLPSNGAHCGLTSCRRKKHPNQLPGPMLPQNPRSRVKRPKPAVFLHFPKVATGAHCILCAPVATSGK